MSISKVKALRAGAEAVVFAKDAKHNVDHNCLCQPALGKWSSLCHSGLSMTPCPANLLN